jgi:hypothetical protein
MIDGDTINVLEFNVRFGDPECEALMMRFESDLAETLLAAAEGNVSRASIRLSPRSAVAVVLDKVLILGVGGETDTHSLTDNEGYDVKADRWVKLAPLPSPRHGIAAASVGNFAYFAGGAQGNGGNGTSDQLFAFSMP